MTRMILRVLGGVVGAVELLATALFGLYMLFAIGWDGGSWSDMSFPEQSAIIIFFIHFVALPIIGIWASVQKHPNFAWAVAALLLHPALIFVFIDDGATGQETTWPAWFLFLWAAALWGLAASLTRLSEARRHQLRSAAIVVAIAGGIYFVGAFNDGLVAKQVLRTLAVTTHTASLCNINESITLQEKECIIDAAIAKQDTWLCQEIPPGAINDYLECERRVRESMSTPVH